MPCGPPVIVFRQSGIGIGLHIEVAPITDCHLDSHQIVVSSAAGFGSVYNFDAIADHFTLDLGPELPRRLDRTSR